MDQGEKTEDPTAKREEQFREEGKIPTSRDIGGVAIVLAALTVFWLKGRQLVLRASSLLEDSFEALAIAPDMARGPLVERALERGSRGYVELTTLLLTACVLVAVVAGIAQTGANVSTKALGFKWERIRLLPGISRVLFSLETLQQIGLSIGKAALIAITLFVVLRGYVAGFVQLPQMGLASALAFIGHVIVLLLGAALGASAVLAAIDYALARQRITKQMKMTKQEVKDEFKQQEGDQAVKQRMRQRMREIGRNQMIAAAREADAVVVNPTHYAVALTYKMGQAGAPKVVAKGKDEVAARIREIARRHQIPIIANPPVARAIYASTRVGHEVPEELYETVAKVIAYLIRIAQARNVAA